MAASLFKWFLAVMCSLAGRHPLYISVTEINHNAKDKTLEISCKMFTNDLEATLEKSAHAKVDLSEPKDKKVTDKLITDYVGRHLQLKVDGKAVSLHFLGSEKEADGTWSYFQVNDIPAVKRIDIVNSLLYDNFEQEINIMHVSVGGVKKSTRLNYPEVNANLEF
jgi:hypothetical protein